MYACSFHLVADVVFGVGVALSDEGSEQCVFIPLGALYDVNILGHFIGVDFPVIEEPLADLGRAGVAVVANPRRIARVLHIVKRHHNPGVRVEHEHIIAFHILVALDIIVNLVILRDGVVGGVDTLRGALRKLGVESVDSELPEAVSALVVELNSELNTESGDKHNRSGDERALIEL